MCPPVLHSILQQIRNQIGQVNILGGLQVDWLPANWEKRSYCINSDSTTLWAFEFTRSKYFGTSYSVLIESPDPQCTCCRVQNPDGHGHKAQPYWCKGTDTTAVFQKLLRVRGQGVRASSAWESTKQMVKVQLSSVWQANPQIMNAYMVYHQTNGPPEGLPTKWHDVGNPSRWTKGSEGTRERKQRKSMRGSIDVKLKINKLVRYQWVTQSLDCLTLWIN